MSRRATAAVLLAGAAILVAGGPPAAEGARQPAWIDAAADDPTSDDPGARVARSGATTAPALAATVQAADTTPPDPFVRPPPETLSARRSRLLDSLGTGAAIVRSASTRDLESDYPQASDFRQNNDFFYLTGLETPDSWLVLAARPGGRVAEILFVPERESSEERWTGPKPGTEEAARISGIQNVRHTSEFEQMVKSGQMAALSQAGPLRLPLNESALADELVREMAATASDVRDIEPVLAQVRLVKDDFEIRMLRHAIEVTDRAQRAAMKAAHPGIYEYELEAVIEYEFRHGGAERVGFPSIVGAGPNSVVLHYDESRRRTEPGDLVVMDIGAEYSYYTADVTRTIPVTGEFTDRQERLYELVLGAQRAALEAVRPGNTMADVSRAAHSYLQTNSGELCGETSCDQHFVHGVGHWLGMDVHDVGSYATPFRPGMVLTVEPGVYLPEEDLGVRIEDDVLVTEDGREVLSTAPKTADEVEAAMAGASEQP